MTIAVTVSEQVAPGAVVQLNWPPAPGASFYRVEMATNSVPPWTTLADNLAATSYGWTVPTPIQGNNQTRLRVTSFGGNPTVQIDQGETGPFVIVSNTPNIAASAAYVIYTGNAIDPANPPAQELKLPNLPAGLGSHTVPMPGVPATGTVVAAWWAPHDNIAALSGFATIVVSPGGGNTVTIQGHGYQASQTRMRLMITARGR